MRDWLSIKTSLVGWLRLVRRFLVVGDLQGLARFESECCLSERSATEVGWEGSGGTAGAWQLWLDEKGEWAEPEKSDAVCRQEIFLMVERGVNLVTKSRDLLGSGARVWLDELAVFGGTVVEHGLRRSRLKLEGSVWEGVCRGIWEEEEFELFRGDSRGSSVGFEQWSRVLSARGLGLGVDGGMVGIEEGDGGGLKSMVWFPYGGPVLGGSAQSSQLEVEEVVREWLRLKLRCWHLWGLVERWARENGLEMGKTAESALWGDDVLITAQGRVATVWVGLGPVAPSCLEMGVLATVIPREENGVRTEGRTWMAAGGYFEEGLREDGLLLLADTGGLDAFGSRVLEVLRGVEGVLRGELLSC